MKKALIIGICVLAAAITVFGFISLRNAALSEETDLLTTLPERPAMLVTIQQPEALTQSLCYNNGFWQYWRKNPSIRLLNVLLTETDSARESKQPLQTNNPIQIAVFFNERQTSSLLSARLSANDWQYWKKRLAHYPLLHNRYENGVLLVSADSAILANASHNLSKRISVLENDTAFLQVRNTAGKQVPMSIYLYHNAWNKLFVQSTGTPSEEADALFNSDAAWSVLDFEASERQFRLCGFAVSDNKTSSLERLRQQMPAPNKLAAALPNGTYYYHHEVINDLEAYRTANGAIRAIEDSMWRTADGTSTLSFFRQYFDGEWIHGLNNDGSFVVVRLNDAASASRDLEKLAEGLHAGQGMPGVYRFGLCGFAASVLGEQARLNREFVSIQGNNLWITSQPGKAAAYAQGPKLTETAAYKAAESDMQTESVQTDYFEIQTLLAKIDKQVTDSWAARHIGWIALGCPFGTAVLQSEYSSVGLTYCNFTAKQAATPLQLAHQPLTNGELLAYNEIHEAQPVQEQATTVSSDVIEPTEDSTVEELPVAVAKTEPLPDSKSRTTVSEMLVQVQLDAPAAMRPQIFKNHLNGENEIVVQDTKKQLYLISATGKIVWKIQLSEFILGDVFAVDMLGNKKWQMTFVTPSKWFVIDRKGNNLAGFPIALNPQASTGLLVVDYENKADYRFFIPRKGGKVNLLKKDGRQPQDWAFKSTGKEVQQPVQHFVAGGKDYIVCTGTAASQIVDRRGRTRIATDGIDGWSQNPLVADGSGATFRMVGTAPDGDLQFVYADGRVISTPIESGVGAAHTFGLLSEGTEKHYILGDSKGLKVYNEDFEPVLNKTDVSVSGKMQYLGKRAYFYNAADKTVWIYDSNKRQCQTTGIGCDSPNLTLSALKPHSGECLITTDKNKLQVYRLK